MRTLLLLASRRQAWLPVLLVVAFWSQVIEAQVFTVVAFGDSITEADPFDIGAGSRCKSSDPDSCGYPARLAGSAFYGCNASTCSFANRGKSGESTAQGVTRVDQVLRQKNWDLMTLMEGTNDLSKISAQTVAFNLGRISDKAKARGVGVAQASVIWYKPSLFRPELGALNSAAQSLRSLVRNQASAARRCFADPWSRLCPSGNQQASCFATNYWQPPPGFIDFVGHPNPNGFDLIADEFFRALGTQGIPGAAEVLEPSGEACGKRPLLSWRKETVAKASCGNWYRLQIAGSGGTKLDLWVQEDDVCSGNSCSLTSPASLKEGDHSFRVRTRNSSGHGPWTADESFTVVESAPAALSGASGPIGNSYSTVGLTAEFRWPVASDSNSYRLEVTGEGGKVIVDELFGESEQCSSSECVFSPADPFLAGEYVWRIRAENICGGTWTDPIRFGVFDTPPEFEPATSAVSRIFDSTPTFRWQDVVGATEFEIEDALGRSSVLSAAENCIGGICRFESAALAPGIYDWRVRALNPLGDGPWSVLESFEVADCDCFEGQAAGGSSFLLATPPNWNGDLVVWSHESNLFRIQEIPDFGALAQRQFDQGYALGATSYSVAGWPLFRSKRDLEKIVSAFTSRHGKPSRVFLAGEATGALVALAGLEKAKLGNVVGVLSLCGPLAGLTNWEGALDLRLAYSAICDAVPGAALPGGPKGLSIGHGLEPRDVASAVNACTGIDLKRAKRTQSQKRRLRDLLAVNKLPERGLQDAMRLATFGLNDLVRDKKKLKGNLPVGNEGVDYGSTALNASIRRTKPVAKGTRQLVRFSELSGKTKNAKIISLHTEMDPVFFVENEREFADLVPADDLLTAVVSETRPSHCGFSDAELAASWKMLTIWAQGGNKPKIGKLQSRCNAIKNAVGGNCRFKTRGSVEHLGTRIRPRP